MLRRVVSSKRIVVFGFLVALLAAAAAVGRADGMEAQFVAARFQPVPPLHVRLVAAPRHTVYDGALWWPLRRRVVTVCVVGRSPWQFHICTVGLRTGASQRPPLFSDRGCPKQGRGNGLRSYTWGDSLVSMVTGGSSYYYLQDGLGSTANLASSSGGTEWTYSYEPFGAAQTTTKNDSSAPDNFFQFATEYVDPQTGLYNMRARILDPAEELLEFRSTRCNLGNAYYGQLRLRRQ